MCKIWAFTFGSGCPLQNQYVLIEAKSSNAAREEMFKHFGPKWSMQYEFDDEFRNQIRQYELHQAGHSLMAVEY